MEIKHIKKLSSGKYSITFLNGESITTYDEVLLSDNLLYKKELSDKEINSIKERNTFYEVYNNTIKYISKRIRSTYEIEKYLDKYDISLNDKKKILSKLKESNLINDERFTSAFIMDKIHLSNDGPHKIKKELQNLHLDEDIIDKYLDKIDYNELKDKLSRLLIKKINLSKESIYNTRKKVTSYFINLGYSKDMIDDLYIDNREEDSLLEKDFMKVYKKLSIKEKDIETLKLKIKQKLYSKGYSLSKIDEVIIKRI